LRRLLGGAIVEQQAGMGRPEHVCNTTAMSQNVQDNRWTGFRGWRVGGYLRHPTSLLALVSRRWAAARSLRKSSVAAPVWPGGPMADGSRRQPSDPSANRHLGTPTSAVWVPDASDELLRLAVQVGGIGIYETDFEQNRARFSPELCDILGLPAGTEMTYAEASQLFDARDRAAVSASIEAAAKSPDEGKWSGVHRIVRRDGTVRWVSIQGRRHYRETAQGWQVVRSVGTVIDVTHLKETEAALRESELRLRLALEAAQMGTFEADIGGSQAIIDAQEAHLLGLPEQTRLVSADELRARIPFEDLQASDAKKERLEQHDEAYHHEFRLRMPDGSERWLSAYAAIKANRVFGVNFDVTLRKQAELALRESEERLRIATSSAALGVFESDVKADRTVWVNDRMYEIFGRSRADGSLTRQEFLQDYLHPDDAHALEDARQEAMRSGGNLHAVCRIRQTRGVQRWVQIDGAYEFDDQGEPSRFFGVMADITERKTLEQEAEELSERLVNLQEEERQRIAQELHDSTAQHLVAANLNLMSLRAKAGKDREEIELWEEVETSMEEALKELRTFSYLMNPPTLQADGLRATLHQYIEGYASRSGLTVRFRSSSSVDDLPFRLQRSLFRIVQEALANVHRHASASQVSVELRRISGRLHLLVVDNGRNAADTAPHEGRDVLQQGVGIRGIRARVRQFGGDLRIRMGAGGTTVHAMVPVGHARRRRAANVPRRKSRRTT
jgi:PAS domain S-box-containing protein